MFAWCFTNGVKSLETPFHQSSFYAWLSLLLMNILITGSSSGIGRALTEHLLGQGHRVWGWARSDQSELIASSDGKFRATRCDVSEWAEVSRAAAEVTSFWPEIDGLVTCAGLQGAVGPAVTLDPLQWSATIRANLDGTYYAIRALHETMRRSTQRAKIVCFSGGGATKPRLNFSAYGVAKTGVVRLVETIAEELRDQPVDINAVAPGAINTRLTDEVVKLGPAVVGAAEYDAAIKQKASGGASLEKALGLVEFLLSQRSNGISGRLLSAPWDPWKTLDQHVSELAACDVYTLRRIVPEERGLKL
jgi:NAD(P)-dependent dehydrogenase (short-subunit alcohol dehydrogenase family)